MVGAVLVAALLGAAFIQIPYYAFAPGSARPTEELIVVDGSKTYPARGSISFTTVSIRKVTLLGALQGWLDDDIEIIPEDKFLNGRGANENRQFNLTLMDNSKNIATTVALQRLGYEVPVHAKGAAVVDVKAGLPAADSLSVGDVITSIDGTDVEFTSELIAAIATHAPGDTVTLEVEAADTGATRTEEVELAAREDDPSQPLLGVVIQDFQVSYDFPFPVTIDSGSVGGPSAGLAFTLGVLDVLTPGDLTGGHDVAVTGTMNADGSVGPVGGVAQKTAAVRRAGIDLFLVPSDEYDEAVAHAGSNLEVVKVDTLDDALKALAPLGGNALALPTPGATGATDA
jgi:PDZ domain-containing protein